MGQLPKFNTENEDPGPKVDINNVRECPRPLLPTAIYEKEKKMPSAITHKVKIPFGEGQRSIFQTFRKLHCCAKSLFFELETSNCGYLFIF